jgi:hypothetical protein
VNLPEDELEYVEFPMNGSTEYFGAADTTAKCWQVDRFRCSVGYRDVAQRQQEVMALLPVLQQLEPMFVRYLKS